MNTYLIGYDLKTKGQNYNCLYDKIKNNYSYWHCLDSTFLVKTNQTSVQIRDFLKPCLDSNDSLLVVTLSGEAAWAGFSDDCGQWLKKNL